MGEREEIAPTSVIYVKGEHPPGTHAITSACFPAYY